MHFCDEELSMDTPEIRKAFCQRIMQNALRHRVGQGIDPVYGCAFQAQGLLEKATPPSPPSFFVEVLRDPNHELRIHKTDGPILFIREGNQRLAVEVAELLLSPDHPIRCTALEYLKSEASSPEPRLTPWTVEKLEDLSEDIQSEDTSRWRGAVVKVVPVIREDLFSNLAGFHQSLSANYDDGVDRYGQLIMQPSFNALANIRPPLWAPSQQQADIENWISEFAELPTLEEALSKYYSLCGHVPLCGKLGAGELARQWSARNSDSEVTWDQLRDWAEKKKSPSAKYHAIIAALYVANSLSDTVDVFWADVVKILDAGTNKDKETEQDANPLWQLFKGLALHFTYHIETLHPCQDGERVACYAWWLAEKVGRMLAGDNEHTEAMLKNIVRPFAQCSSAVWSFSRSPVMPSHLRYATLFTKSHWAMSLLAQLSQNMDSLPLEQIPDVFMTKIGRSLSAYLIGTPLANYTSSSVYAFQENGQLAEFCKQVTPTEHYESVMELVQMRQKSGNRKELAEQLDRLLELPSGVQYLAILLLKDIVFTTHDQDDTISRWLSRTDDLVLILKQLPESLIAFMLEALSEFNQRPQTEWAIRLPHILVYTLEQVDDKEHAEQLCYAALQMSLNAGIVSPIQRMSDSKWKSDVLEWISVWRRVLVRMTGNYEPWVAARVRATSATISRIIGPFDNSTQMPEATSPVESL